MQTPALWETWEVFHQARRGEQHAHVGIVHAPNADMALLFAKEQFARRWDCVNLWVVRTRDVYMTSYNDADMFEPSFDKSYRDAAGYHNREKVEEFTKGRSAEMVEAGQSLSEEEAAAQPQATAGGNSANGQTAAKQKGKKATIVRAKGPHGNAVMTGFVAKKN